MRRILLPVFITLVLCGCASEDNTGEVQISVINRTDRINTIKVLTGIVLSETDESYLIEYPIRDISDRGSTQFNIENLLEGNYYVRSRYFIGSSASSPEHKPFQVIAGELTDVRIEL